MEKIITTIATQLLSKLSKDRITYTQKDLSDSGFPPFLIKRITFHLLNELKSEFKLPGEEWLNPESDELLSEWEELQRTIKKEIHLPAFLAQEIVKKSVKECLGMTIQPRKVIPELLFEDDAVLDSNQLTERSSAITVNRFLVWSVVRYMEKKNRRSLNISDAKRIIESIENKIIENYHPLNWLSLVKPLYELSGSSVHSDLFRRFFEHKGKNHLAKEFDLIADRIKESRFIEILSSPNSIHVDGYKDDQQSLFQGDEVKKDAVVADESKEDLFENQNELNEDQSENNPIFLSISEDSVKEPDGWDQDDGWEQVYVPVEEEIVDQVSNQEVDNLEEDLQDEELKAPWEDEEEDAFTFITHDDVEDSTDSEIIGLHEEDHEEAIEELIQEENEPLKKEGTASDASLLEIDDEEEGLNSSFKLMMDQDESKPKVGKSDLDALEESDEADLVSDFDSDTELNDGALLDRFQSIRDQNESIPKSDEVDLEDFDSSEESVTLNVDKDPESEDGSDKEDSSLLNRFMFDDSVTSDTISDIESAGGKKINTIYDELNLVRNDVEPETMDLFGSFKSHESEEQATSVDQDKKSSDVKTKKPETIQKFSDLAEPKSEEDSDDTEVPMWRSFLERDENDVKSAFQFDEKSENDEEGSGEENHELLDEDGFIEEPIYDFTQKEPDLDEKIGDLSNWMKDVREKFIEELFGDSEDAYEQALSDIMEFGDWKNASKYIEKEIFTRNRIDVYGEIAVDFTDRLHSYFIENKS